MRTRIDCVQHSLWILVLLAMTDYHGNRFSVVMAVLLLLLLAMLLLVQKVTLVEQVILHGDWTQPLLAGFWMHAVQGPSGVQQNPDCFHSRPRWHCLVEIKRNSKEKKKGKCEYASFFCYQAE